MHMDFDEAIAYIKSHAAFETKEHMLAFARCMAAHMRWEDYQAVIDLWTELNRFHGTHTNGLHKDDPCCLFQVHPTIQNLLINYANCIRGNVKGEALGTKVLGVRDDFLAKKAYRAALNCADEIFEHPIIAWDYSFRELCAPLEAEVSSSL